VCIVASIAAIAVLGSRQGGDEATTPEASEPPINSLDSLPPDGEDGQRSSPPPASDLFQPQAPSPTEPATQPPTPGPTQPATQPPVLDTVPSIPPETTPRPSNDSAPAGAPADVGSCRVSGENSVVVEVANGSTEQTSFHIEVNFLNSAGDPVGTERVFVNFLRPGETSREEHFVADADGGTACAIGTVDRYPAASQFDVTEATCEIAGLDVAGNIETRHIATNGSSAPSDYLITAAVVREGIRVGLSTAAVEGVELGMSVSETSLSSAAGPAEGATCETVHIEKFDLSN